jgi:CheY-like chemotaxis protein
VVLAPLTGTEAIRLLGQEPVDLLNTDILMPDMDGVEVIREVQRLRPSLKILAMSGGGMDTMPEIYLRLVGQIGAVKTLAKPFAYEELIAVVRELID